ncbi:MAG: hypothetical protein CMJ25_15215 [Phycisphaerae bacterium]|nr:hypothetical protein [Phycisphaerae bacterium]|tara:strand:- start:158 stop:406 length:249 start_codon:yes stop_codon:yes gene_type:complete
MAITTETINDIIDARSMGDWSVVQVRSATVTIEDGVQTSRSFHRHVIMPDADLSTEDVDVAALCESIFTDEVKAAYAAAQED